MNIGSRLMALFLVLFLVSQNPLADEIVGTWSATRLPGVTSQSIEAAKRIGHEEIAKRNLTVDSWPDAVLLMVAAEQHKGEKSLLTALISQLTDRKKAELKDTTTLIIWERITSGEILFEGMGYQISDDLFTVAGRANWMLRNITRKNFGHIKPHTSPEELVNLQQRWQRWSNGEPVEEYQNQYTSTAKRLAEVRRGITGPETIEALITSLQPHKSKSLRREKCLSRTAHLFQGPYPGLNPSPDRGFDEVCHPDFMTRLYLSLITGMKRNTHGYGWWKKWWDTNRDQLMWNREKGIFEVKK